MYLRTYSPHIQRMLYMSHVLFGTYCTFCTYCACCTYCAYRTHGAYCTYCTYCTTRRTYKTAQTKVSRRFLNRFRCFIVKACGSYCSEVLVARRPNSKIQATLSSGSKKRKHTDAAHRCIFQYAYGCITEAHRQ